MSDPSIRKSQLLTRPWMAAPVWHQETSSLLWMKSRTRRNDNKTPGWAKQKTIRNWFFVVRTWFCLVQVAGYFYSPPVERQARYFQHIFPCRNCDRGHLGGVRNACMAERIS